MVFWVNLKYFGAIFLVLPRIYGIFDNFDVFCAILLILITLCGWLVVLCGFKIFACALGFWYILLLLSNWLFVNFAVLCGYLVFGVGMLVLVCLRFGVFDYVSVVCVEVGLRF